MAVTLHTIAQKAGVSAPVVSAVVNNNYKNCRVSPEKRKRIQELIEELNYLPNTTARNLVKKETRTVNVIIPSVNFFATSANNRFVMGVQDSIEEKGYRLTFTSLQRGYRDYRSLTDTTADALLVFMWGTPQEHVARKLLKFNKPLMVAFARCDIPGVHNVWFDNRTGGYRLARHLMEAGHTNLMYAEAFGGDYFHEQLRLGVEQAVSETENIMFKKVRLDVQGFDYYNANQQTFQMGRQMADTLMTDMPGATALMCTHDTMAFGAIQRLQETGKRVPDDVSVTGADDHSLAGSLAPGLTTITNRALEGGRKAGALLVDIMSGKVTEPRSVKIVNEPIIRESIINRIP